MGTGASFWRNKCLLGPGGGFLAVLGFLLPFHAGRSLFAMMDGATLPFLPQALLLAVVAVIVLYGLDFYLIPAVISMLLFFSLCILYAGIFASFPFFTVIANLQIGAFLLPLGMLAMTLDPLFAPEPK